MMHTSGPWFARRGLHGWGIDKSASHGICTIHDNTDGSMREEQAANAHLIAAAPEMLEALQKLADHVQYDLGVYADSPYIKRARDVISKAINRE